MSPEKQEELRRDALIEARLQSDYDFAVEELIIDSHEVASIINYLETLASKMQSYGYTDVTPETVLNEIKEEL